MAGVMFIACIPTKEHERDAYPFPSEEKKAKKRNVKIEQGNDVSLDIDEQVSLLADEEDSEKSPSDKSAAERASADKESKSGDEEDDSRRQKGKHEKDKLEVSPDSSMEEILICILRNLKIDVYSWVPVKNNKFIHVMFSVTDGPPFEEALHMLTKWGIGVRGHSTLGIVPCALYFRSEDSKCSDDEDEAKAKSRNNCQEVWKQAAQDVQPHFVVFPFVNGGKESGKSGWNEFLLSVVRSRLAVAQVVESVKGSAKLTFDFVSLIILAGTIAAVGLVENSTVSIVASMLISPLMGPILAGTFGTVIHDRKLQLMGVRNELIGLALTILVGFFIGLIIGGFDEFHQNDQWPTEEMMSRGLLRSLWIGIFIALPSGAGVALGLLSDNSGSLIGVAISASLLPPAVNAGLLWALSALAATDIIEIRNGTAPSPPPLYSTHLATEYALLGCVSLSLTLINIICIFIAGIVVLRIKEVAPRALTDDVQQFWRHDIKVARDYNRSINKEDAREFEKQLAEELAHLSDDRDVSMTVTPGEDYATFRRRLSSMYHFSPDTIRRISVGPRRLSQSTWSPSPSSGLDTHRRSSVRDLEKLYASLSGTEPPRFSVPTAWKVASAQLRRGKQSEDVSTLSPIIENNGGIDGTPESGRRTSYLPLRRNPRGHRFTVIPSACDPLKNKT